jgi:hypothetical protein
MEAPLGKEEIGEAALTLAGEAVRQTIARAAEASDSAGIFLSHIARGTAADRQVEYQKGCPFATTALETAAQSDVLCATTRTAFQKWETESKRGLECFGMMPRSDRDRRAQPAQRRAIAGAHLSQSRADAPRRAGVEAAGAYRSIGMKLDCGARTWWSPGKDRYREKCMNLPAF